MGTAVCGSYCGDYFIILAVGKQCYSKGKIKYMTQDILNRFLDDDGRVAVWPSKHRYKVIVLSYLATKFEYDRFYNEKDVNEILKRWHTFEDWPLLRRELVDRHYMARDTNGYRYERLTLYEQPK